ncbi:hypothetical protein JCM10908_007135 [Rhodotorula pacifica]|uniref:tetratricopeptide repeat protein n=1 Tax=Rhodotorula pacifica TaxID=1495444 RepID=UPI00317273CE
MLASLAGGASCGPSNPLQQLSKTYTADRGAQQDHFAGSQAGPSGQHSFRAQASTNSADPAAQQFFQQQQQQQHSGQSFNLSPLHHALPSTSTGPSSSTAPPPPAWAQAFAAQAPVMSGAAEQEMFARAFGGGGAHSTTKAAPAWVGDFHASTTNAAAAGPRAMTPAAAQQLHASSHQQQQGLSRLQGQGFAMQPPPAGLMVNYLRGHQQQESLAGAGGMQMMVTPESMAAARESEGKADWDAAFETRQADAALPVDAVITDRILPALNETDFSSHVHETRPLTPPLRAHSPVADSQAAKDALAQTAANLLATVRSAEEQRLRAETGSTEETTVGNKFAQSEFMQLMRQLRDGQVAVEGDKVVEQSTSSSSVSASKGKARADGWASDFVATTVARGAELHQAFDREEEGRVNSMASAAAAAPILQPGQSVASHAHEQHTWARDQAESARLVRELQEGFQAMHGLWNDEDRARAARERAASNKGKGKEREPFIFQGDGGNLVDSDHEQQDTSTHVPLAQASWEEDFDDPSMIVGGHALGGGIARRPSVGRMSAQQMEWDMLQRDWDEMDATATGLKPRNQVEATGHGYSFAQNNPYATLEASTTRHHAPHHVEQQQYRDDVLGTDDLSAALTERHDSLLQREAEVLREPHSASAWLSLGLKQQQNEREELAIAALRRAAELDPFVADGAAHLALSVSYTNEGRRTDAYEHLNKWVDAIAQDRTYANEIAQYRNLFGNALPNSIQDRQTYLSNMLIRLAQSRAETRAGADGIDADVQVALGVLFNSSEEYEKASDCFEAALSVRPDDPLLFNRLGATYANSGKTEAAMQYYHAALDLDPGYVRARYNLAVACMNVGKHEDAVRHLLTSLSIQEADSELDSMQQGPPPSAESGHVSHALWDMLHVSLLQMHRSDIAPLAAAHDLRALLQAFSSE